MLARRIPPPARGAPLGSKEFSSTPAPSAIAVPRVTQAPALGLRDSDLPRRRGECASALGLALRDRPGCNGTMSSSSNSQPVPAQPASQLRFLSGGFGGDSPRSAIGASPIIRFGRVVCDLYDFVVSYG